MNRIFREGNFLIPKTEYLAHWPVIAVDQYTSQPEYWEEIRKMAGDSPSSLHCVFPEAFLSDTDTEEIRMIHRQMKAYLEEGIFRKYPDSYIYIERTVSSGIVRRGILGCIDLEAYDYADDTDLPIRATEKTVTERLPSRIAIRQGALLELSHVILLCDDERRQLIESIDPRRLPLLYDVDLKAGGRVKGRLIAGRDALDFNARLNQYYEDKKGSALLFAAGDGNHSIAAAKEVYEALKKQNPDIDYTDRCERYMSVELENIHDPIQEFRPIHRILRNVDPGHVLSCFGKECGCEDGYALPWYAGKESGEINIDISACGYACGTVQKFLDRYMDQYGGEIDYIHDPEILRSLCGQDCTVGFILSAPDSGSFFRTIEENGAYVRKTFSIGEADDKRYYLEARRITE